MSDILAAIARIEDYVADIGGLDALMRDRYVHRDAVERQLLIVSEAARKLRGQVEQAEPDIDWDAIRGMGNVIRHDYDGVDDEIVEGVISTHLRPLAEACRRLQARFGG